MQREDRSITFRYVRGSDWDERAFGAIMTRFTAYLRGLPLKLEERDDIPAMPNGKRKTIVVEA